MYYEIPVAMDVTQRFMQWANDEMPFFMFKTLAPGHENTVFLVTHGNTDGDLLMHKDYTLTPQQTLEVLIKKGGLRNAGITQVYVIACHGGLIKDIEIEGITLSSLHSSVDEVRTACRELWEDEYPAALLLETNEPDEEA